MGTIYLGYSLDRILAELVKIRDYYAGFPFVRRTALAVGAPKYQNDQQTMFTNIVNFVKYRMRYVCDPYGFEWVTAPDVLLADIMQKGVAYGDCDDHALLLNTMLQTVGFDTRFAAVKISPTDTELNHMISMVNLNGNWIDVDACAKFKAQPKYAEKLVSNEQMIFPS